MIRSIVEGSNDEDAMKCLLKGYKEKKQQLIDINIAKPTNAGGRSRIIKDLEKFLERAAIGENDAILVVLDADNDKKDCPGSFAQELAKRAKKLKLPHPIGIVVATVEYEAWLIASIETIAPKHPKVLRQNVKCQQDPDKVSDPKGWLKQNRSEKPYDEAVHQGRMTEDIDFDCAERNSRSFRRLLKTIEEIVKVATDNKEEDKRQRGYVTPNTNTKI